jgi:bifunctional non-homologous end joining protein LigD
VAGRCRKEKSVYRVSECFFDGPELFNAVEATGLEGIMAKAQSSVYQIGRRSDKWLKIKVRNAINCYILGFTKGTGDRRSSFGALHLGEVSDKTTSYYGSVGTGFDQKSLKKIAGLLKEVPVVKKPVKGKVTKEPETVWIESRHRCRVQFASKTTTGRLREPVFLELITE